MDSAGSSLERRCSVRGAIRKDLASAQEDHLIAVIDKRNAMPSAPPHACGHPGCSARVPRGQSRCDAHAKQLRRQSDAGRLSSTKRGYDGRWRKESAEYLRQHPDCVDCGKAAVQVDHIRPHKGDMILFWDKSNWAGRCGSCHSIKTNKYDGGFGNKERGA